MTMYENDIIAQDAEMVKDIMPDENTKSKIRHLPGTILTPEVVLHRTLEKIKDIESVTIVVKNKDGTYECDWSQQALSKFALGIQVLQEDFRRSMLASICPYNETEDFDEGDEL